MSKNLMPTSIIQPSFWYANKINEKLLKNPLIDADCTIGDIDNPLAEICALSFYSLSWTCKYIFGTEIAPFQEAFLYALWTRKYPLLLASRGASKTFTLGLYALLRAVFQQGSKIIMVSSSFRQAKRPFEELEKVFRRAPLLRSALNTTPKHSNDCWYFNVGDSVIKALPLGDGGKIRGERASVVIIDEVDEVDPEVFHVVVRGFAATQLDPMEKVKEAAKRRRDGLGVAERKLGEGNQIIIAGTAGFTEGNFHRMFLQYNKIIDSRVRGYGYESKVIDALGSDYGDVYVDCRDYGIIELPWQYVPDGILDREMVSQARLTMSDMLFDMEYNCIFADTSHGFFSHKAIEAATAKGADAFGIEIMGSPDKRYILGLDPARTSDAFGFVILEVGYPHKIVYIHTNVDVAFSENVKRVRDLLRRFNVVRIGMDAGGGGLTIKDMLVLDEFTQQSERPIYEVEADDQTRPGDYILQMINFAPKWIEEANFLLQKNIEDKNIMFPSRVINPKHYTGTGIINETEADLVFEEVINCKKELYQISVTQTPHGIRHFDINPSLEAKKRKIRPRKDRYSALLIANYIANDYLDFIEGRKDNQAFVRKQWENAIGGWAEDF
jgi:hypothetical protein